MVIFFYVGANKIIEIELFQIFYLFMLQSVF